MKLPNGAGSVRTVRRAGKPDRFQALSPPDADGRRTSLGVYGDRGEADRVREAAVRQLVDEAGGIRVRGGTLRTFAERYLDEREHDAPRSVKAERYRWSKFSTANFLDDPLDLVGTPRIQAFLAALARQLPASAVGAKAVLSGMYGAAMRAGLAAANPVTAVKLPPHTRTHETWTYLLLDEQRRLLAAPVPEHVRLMITVWLYTGLRSGEICALRLSDVHLDRAVIVVRHGSLRGPTKGKRIRTVNLPPPALEALRRWLGMLPATNRYGLVFPGARGGARDVGHVFRYDVGTGAEHVRHDGWREALAVAGIVPAGRHDGQAVRCHDLRHTCAASLVSGMWGPPWRLEEVQQHLGHATITETQIYAHLAPGVVGDLASRTTGVSHGLVTDLEIAAARASDPAKPSFRGPIYAARSDRSEYPTGNQPLAVELARSALELAAEGSPLALPRALEACEAVLAEQEVGGLRRQQAGDGRGRP